jgi:hypothetical protein
MKNHFLIERTSFGNSGSPVQTGGLVVGPAAGARCNLCGATSRYLTDASLADTRR